MSQIEIHKVENKSDRRRFVTFPWKIYKGDPLWVPPLVPQRIKQINPKKGKFLAHSQADFYIAYKDGKAAGTIMGADDQSSNEMRQLHDCMFGFFECIDDQQVANALFDCAAEWGKQHGLTRLTGPFQMDYDSAYGILIEGRDRPPAINCGHTPVYYQRLVERYGFEPLRPDNIAFAIDVREETPALKLLHRLAEKASQKGNIHIREGNIAEWDKEADRIFVLLNKALKHLADYTGWDREALNDTLEPFRKFADPYLILFADVDDKTVGFFPGIPNLNEILIHINGLRYPWDYFKLLIYSRRKPKCLAIKSVLVLPEYWGSGFSLMLFDEMNKRVRNRDYEWVDLSLTSIDNPKTPVLAERMGGKIYKRYRIYQFPL